MSLHVNVDNFVRAETDRMFAALQAQAGGINRLSHNRAPTPIDQQPVIRMNRDTLYSMCLVDLADGATVTIPEAGDRYLSVMVVDNDHYINEVLHDPGTHELSVERHGTEHVLVSVRILADPNDPDDLAAVADLQDRFAVTAGSARPFVSPDYDVTSFDATRNAILQLASGMSDFDDTFGRRDEVDPVRHLLGTAAGWGGLPSSEAMYEGVFPGLPVGEYELTVGEVPVDGFWSISMYDADGYFAPNEIDAYSVNDITGVRNADGTITVRFGGDGTQPNTLPITDGWNYIVRMYRPRAEIRNGSWSFPRL